MLPSGQAFDDLTHPPRVLLVDDILDEGHTLLAVKQWCLEQGATDVRVAVLTVKRHDRCVPGVTADYVGVEVADRYVFGFGMDYHEQGRNLPGIYALKDSAMGDIALAVIGGTGVYKLADLQDVQAHDLDTRFGAPSGPVTVTSHARPVRRSAVTGVPRATVPPSDVRRERSAAVRAPLPPTARPGGSVCMRAAKPTIGAVPGSLMAGPDCAPNQARAALRRSSSKYSSRS